MSELLQVIILGIVEGVTEFLPISSTGHLLLCEDWMGLRLSDPFWKSFTIFIQIGAIAAVVVYFRERILELLLGPARTLKQMTPLEIAAAMRAAQARELARARAKERATAAGAAAAAVTGGDGADAPALAGADADEPEVVGFVPTAGLGEPPTERMAMEYEAALQTSGAGAGREAGAAAATTAVGRLATPQERMNALLMIVLATVPVLVIGFLTHKYVEAHLETPTVIATALLVGGALMLGVELFPITPARTARIEAITWKQAIVIGFAQVLSAVFPGTSRSAATILGGLCVGLSRPAAAEFSFFLAIPAMGAASAYSLLKFLKGAHATVHEVLLMIIGTLVSFLVAWAVIAAFMTYIRRHTFVPFAVYRILLGGLVLWITWGGR